jgi:hypothetical protein|tara:strand:- start:276 stop:563 length:288 start_codon:yes stop_codon:yes gene_type:complete
MNWVLIHWLDITSFEQPWATKEEASELMPAEMWSAGVLLKDLRTHVVLAGTIGPGGDDDLCYGNVNSIPRGAVKSIRVLEERGFYESAVEDADRG